VADYLAFVIGNRLTHMTYPALCSILSPDAKHHLMYSPTLLDNIAVFIDRGFVRRAHEFFKKCRPVNKLFSRITTDTLTGRRAIQPVAIIIDPGLPVVSKVSHCAVFKLGVVQISCALFYEAFQVVAIIFQFPGNSVLVGNIQDGKRDPS